MEVSKVSAKVGFCVAGFGGVGHITLSLAYMSEAVNPSRVPEARARIIGQVAPRVSVI